MNPLNLKAKDLAETATHYSRPLQGVNLSVVFHRAPLPQLRASSNLG
jgi:hypothetical protein